MSDPDPEKGLGKGLSCCRCCPRCPNMPPAGSGRRCRASGARGQPPSRSSPGLGERRERLVGGAPPPARSPVPSTGGAAATWWPPKTPRSDPRTPGTPTLRG